MKGRGRWTKTEHALYLEAMACFKSWDLVAKHVRSRDPKQCRSHDQKMKRKDHEDTSSFKQDNLKRPKIEMKQASTQWEEPTIDVFQNLPTLLLDRLSFCADSVPSFSTCSTGNESLSSSLFMYNLDPFSSSTCGSSDDGESHAFVRRFKIEECTLLSVSALPSKPLGEIDGDMEVNSII
jgi:hypothetical protein